MPAVAAGLDLGAIALCLVAIGLLLVAKELASELAGAFDVSILGTRPFHRISAAIEDGIIGALDGAIEGVEAVTAKFLSGLVEAWHLMLNTPRLLADAAHDALSYFWNTALMPRVRGVTGPIKATAENALDVARDAASDAARNLTAAKNYAEAQASSALTSAKSYALGRVNALESELRGDIAAAMSGAERYADGAVARLKAAEDEAVAGAVAMAAAAKAAGIAAAADALELAEREIGVATRTAEAAAADALAASEAAITEALNAVRSVAIDASQELDVIEGAAGAVGVAALIASIPAIATLVNAIASEAGLENGSCRRKVKDICGTDPSALANLLGGLAAIGFAFNLRELFELAEPLVGELAPIIREAA